MIAEAWCSIATLQRPCCQPSPISVWALASRSVITRSKPLPGTSTLNKQQLDIQARGCLSRPAVFASYIRASAALIATWPACSDWLSDSTTALTPAMKVVGTMKESNQTWATGAVRRKHPQRPWRGTTPRTPRRPYGPTMSRSRTEPRRCAAKFGRALPPAHPGTDKTLRTDADLCIWSR